MRLRLSGVSCQNDTPILSFIKQFIGELGLNGSVQFKFSNNIAATPAALLDLFLQEKELESSTKINAWTHLYLGNSSSAYLADFGSNNVLQMRN